MGSIEPVLVVSTPHTALDSLVRVEGESPEALLFALDELSADVQALAAIDDAVSPDGEVDVDVLIALASVLVVRGVTRFETTHPRSVRRILDTYAGIQAGEIEVLTP
jgi:hypothetical protein